MSFRGFVKYKRARNQYRDPAERLGDWGEVYNHKGVMDGLRTQAARYVKLGTLALLLPPLMAFMSGKIKYMKLRF